MKITLNNRQESFEFNEITVEQLLRLKNFTFKFLVIKINGKLVKKGTYNKAIINDGDDVAVIHLISGG